MLEHNFKKRFGQNFLLNQEAAQRLVDSLNLQEGETVIEIGPGHGALTDLLIKYPIDLVAVEIDPEAVTYLEEKYQHYQNFRLINEDFLKLNLQEVINNYDFKAIGSLPYNISKKIIFQLLTSTKQPLEFSVIIQKEVAQNYVSKPPQAEFLGNFSQILAEVTYLGTIPANDFYPRPQVDGGMLHFSPNRQYTAKISKQIKFIKSGYASPRKTLANNLPYEKQSVNDCLLQHNLSSTVRAQELTLAQWESLYTCLTNRFDE